MTGQGSTTGRRVVQFEDVDLATWLLSGRDVDAIRAKTHQQLGALLDKADLVETVVTYVACGLDIRTHRAGTVSTPATRCATGFVGARRCWTRL
jgi:hypothetical protein